MLQSIILSVRVKKSFTAIQLSLGAKPAQRRKRINKKSNAGFSLSYAPVDDYNIPATPSSAGKERPTAVWCYLITPCSLLNDQ